MRVVQFYSSVLVARPFVKAIGQVDRECNFPKRLRASNLYPNPEPVVKRWLSQYDLEASVAVGLKKYGGMRASKGNKPHTIHTDNW